MLKFLLPLIAAISALSCSSINVANAQTANSDPSVNTTLDGDRRSAILQALSQTTFNSSAPTATGSSYVADPRIPQIPSFSYTKGTPLAQALPAAFVPLLGSTAYSPQTATQAAGEPNVLASGNLSSLPFVGKLPLAATIAANPQLNNLKVGDVFPAWTSVDSNATLGSIANSAQGKLPIPSDVLASTPVGNLPGILTTPYNNYPGIGKPDLPGFPSIDLTATPLGVDGVKISDLVGIPNIPWNKLIAVGNLPAGLAVMKFDKLNSGQNKISLPNGSKIASGSNKEPNAPCSGICDAAELLSAIDPQNNANPLNGSLSIIGQQLRGGYGLLGDIMTAAGIREPAGFEVPYIGINGCGSKWSAESPDAQAGTIQQQLNFRFCYSVPFLGFQASPYFIPLPLPLPTSEKQANLLLPMMVPPVIIVNPLRSVATTPSIPSSTAVAALATPGDSKVPFIKPTSDGSDKVALFGSATKKAYSPSLGISSNDA
jgi:hypothetical protein